MPPQEFDGCVAVVTGASSGIGRATAEMLLSRGAVVAAFARTATSAGLDPRMLTIDGDVSDPDAIEQLFAETESRFGACDLLINNAGMIDPKPIEATSADDWDRMFAVNVRGAFLCARRALRAMKSGATIINVASISGVVGPEKFPGWISYCASKGAVISMTEAMAVELKGRGVRVNCVSPGSVDTKMWAEASGGAPADMTPDEVAETILFLASARSRPINGQNVHVW
jgi:3-oxoacyl-[acyl-carrier protein] reductase